MFADLYVTATAIFKFNKRLASMEKIAGELHEISNQIGEDIYEKVIFAMEKQEVSKQKLDEVAAELRENIQEVSEEMRSRIAELKNHYQELGSKTPRVSRRLVKAFPKMESRSSKHQLEELRKKFNLKKKK